MNLKESLMVLGKTDIACTNFSGIYVLKAFGINKFYIGSSKNINRRLKNHFRDLINKKHCCTYLQNYFNKYGNNSLYVYDLIETSIDELDVTEQRVLDYYNKNYKVFNILLYVNKRNVLSNKKKIQNYLEDIKFRKTFDGQNLYKLVLNIKSLIDLGVTLDNKLKNYFNLSNILYSQFKNRHWDILSKTEISKFQVNNDKILEKQIKEINEQKFKYDISLLKYPLDLYIIFKTSKLYFDKNERLEFGNRSLNKLHFNKIVQNYYNLKVDYLPSIARLAIYKELPNTIEELSELLSDKNIYQKLLDNIQDIDKEVIFPLSKTNLKYDVYMMIKLLGYEGVKNYMEISKYLGVPYIDVHSNINAPNEVVEERSFVDYKNKNMEYYLAISKYINESCCKTRKECKLDDKRINEVLTYIELENRKATYEEFNKLGFTKIKRRYIRKLKFYKDYKLNQNSQV